MTITRKQNWEEKQLYGRFKRLLNNISHEKTLTWLRKGNLKTETKSLQIAAQNEAIRTNHIKARIYKKLQWDFEIQIDHLITARRPGLIIINNKKENLQNC